MLFLLSVLLLLQIQHSHAVCKGCYSLNMHDGPTERYIEWDDIFNLTLSPSYAGISWAKKGPFYYHSTNDGIYKVNARSQQKIRKYFDLDDLFAYGNDFDIAEPETHAIMWKVTKSIYRHSFQANYTLLNMATKVATVIDPTGTNAVQWCAFTPTGTTMVMVAGNDLYSKKVGDDSYFRHTYDGLENIIFNGIPDWVYEEEVVSNHYSTYPSPDSKFVLFTKTNATGVKHVRFPIYGEDTYAKILDYEYPKAGYTNPTIQTWLADIDNPEQAQHLPTPKDVLDWGEHYLYTVSWASNDTVVCEWWNRAQTKVTFYQCNVHNKACSLVIKDESKGGWMDWWSKPFWYFDGLKRFARLEPSNQGIDGDFKHVALYTENNEGTWDSQFLTSGTYDVLSIYAQNTEKDYLFYWASKGGQMYRHVFKLDLVTKKSTCLSCDDYCGYAAASFSADATLYRLNCYGPVVPYVQLKEVDSSFHTVLEANENLELLLKQFTLPKISYQTERVAGFDINIKRIVPPDFQENGSKRYPVLLYVYGGPGSGNVKDDFPFGDQRRDFHSYLANGDKDKPSFIIYYIDVRGTLGRGDDFRFPLYKKFGITEVDDTLEFISKMRNYPYVDDARIAIWGWSYGGFLTAKVVSSGKKLVQAGISVAPVTSFYFYDTIYTERYMGLPTEDDNKVNYDKGGVLHEAGNFSGTKFFLIHGSADDNVHFTNAARLAKNLVEEEYDFRMHIYTDKAHSLRGTHTRKHLYKMMRDWLYDALNLKDPYYFKK